MPVDKFGRMSDAKTTDTGVSLTYINNTYVRSDGSTPVTSSIDMKGNSLNNIGDPGNPQDVATKDYVDKVGGSPFFKENGNYQAMHTINMNFRKLVNLQKPTEPFDAVTKDYVDYVRSYIIAVQANYYGRLEKDTFGGNTIQPNVNNINNGFLIPQSERTKEISLQDYGYRFYYKDSKDFLDQLGLSSGTPVPVFTIVLIRNNREVSDLTTYKCTFEFDGRVELSGGIISDCIFTPDPRNISILNIRTEVNNIPNTPAIFTVRTKPNFNTDEIKDDFFTYLFTFLIELDPL